MALLVGGAVVALTGTAGLGWYLFGSSSAPKKTEEPEKSPIDQVIQELTQKLPSQLEIEIRDSKYTLRKVETKDKTGLTTVDLLQLEISNFGKVKSLRHVEVEERRMSNPLEDSIRSIKLTPVKPEVRVIEESEFAKALRSRVQTVY